MSDLKKITQLKRSESVKIKVIPVTNEAKLSDTFPLSPKRPPSTPECFKTILFETPKNSEERISKLYVGVRIRPLNSREMKNQSSINNCLSVNGNELTVHYQNELSTNTFQYDHVFLPQHDQQNVYDIMGKPILDEAFQGYNACLFAYGQTGSGKTYSMMGNDEADRYNYGIIPRLCENLFKKLEKIKCDTSQVEISYFEIYNEKIHDLLSTSITSPKTPNQRREALKVREHPVWGPYVVDLSVHPVNSYEALNSWLKEGNKRREVAFTQMNDKSSRSHCIFTISLKLDGTHSRHSKINLVDLAGSERLGNAINDERLKQGVSINKSLLTLGKVISALCDQNACHIPYRESVLTWLLKESLGGNSRTRMLATITPASFNLDETLSTLRYASKARNIVNRICVNEDPHDKVIRDLRREIDRLKASVHKKSVKKINVPTQTRKYLVENKDGDIYINNQNLNLQNGERILIDNFEFLNKKYLIEKENGEIFIKNINLKLQNGDQLLIDNYERENNENDKNLINSENFKLSNLDVKESKTILDRCGFDKCLKRDLFEAKTSEKFQNFLSVDDGKKSKDETDQSQINLDKQFLLEDKKKSKVSEKTVKRCSFDNKNSIFSYYPSDNSKNDDISSISDIRHGVNNFAEQTNSLDRFDTNFDQDLSSKSTSEQIFNPEQSFNSKLESQSTFNLKLIPEQIFNPKSNSDQAFNLKSTFEPTFNAKSNSEHVISLKSNSEQIFNLKSNSELEINLNDQQLKENNFKSPKKAFSKCERFNLKSDQKNSKSYQISSDQFKSKLNQFSSKFNKNDSKSDSKLDKTILEEVSSKSTETSVSSSIDRSLYDQLFNQAFESASSTGSNTSHTNTKHEKKKISFNLNETLNELILNQKALLNKRQSETENGTQRSTNQKIQNGTQTEAHASGYHLNQSATQTETNENAVETQTELEDEINILEKSFSEDVQEQLNHSLNLIESFYETMNNLSKTKCSTPDAPIDISPYKSNFLEELEKLLTILPENDSEDVEANVGRQDGCRSALKKVMFDRQVSKLFEICDELEEFYPEVDKMVEALRFLRDSIQTVKCALNFDKKHKQVQFLADF